MTYLDFLVSVTFLLVVVITSTLLTDAIFHAVDRRRHGRR